MPKCDLESLKNRWEARVRIQCRAHARFDCWENACMVAETARDSHTRPYGNGGYLFPAQAAKANEAARNEPLLTPEQWATAVPVVFHMAEHGQWFGTRGAGARIRAFVEKLLDGNGRKVVIDFTGVEAITGGFADELVVELVSVYGARITTTCGNEEVTDAIQAALSRRLPRRTTTPDSSPDKAPGS